MPDHRRFATIGKIMDHIERYPTEAERRVVCEIAVSLLPPNLARIYDLIAERGAIESADVIERFGVNQNHAATDLIDLHRLGLLRRHKTASNAYRYTIATPPRPEGEGAGG